jgi:hypothetical protein
MLPGSPAAASLIASALPAYVTYLQSFGLADAPDLQPATLLTSLGKTQSTISRAVNKVRGERFWPSPITAGSRGHSADVFRRLVHQASLRQTESKEWLTGLPSACMQATAHLFPTQLMRYLQDPVYAAGTMCSYCHLELDVYGHHAFATCTHQLSRLHRHNTLTHVIRRWVFMIARLYPNYETRALVPHSTDRPADLLVLVRGLDSDQPDMARHAIDVTVCDPIGSSNLTDARKALSSPSAGPAIGEARKRVRFAAKITQAQLMVPDWVPDFAFHPMGFDLNGTWGPSALHILDFTAALSSQATTEPQARIKRRSIQVISRTSGR